MYAGKSRDGVNHRRSVCADGCFQAARKYEKTLGDLNLKTTGWDEPPPFPQPEGIFTDGTHFHPIAFSSAVESLWQRVSTGTAAKGTYAMQDIAFASLLHTRCKVIDSPDAAPVTLFLLYESLKLGHCPPDLLVLHDGHKYLRVDVLSATIVEGGLS